MHRAQDLHVGENGSSVRWIISMVIMLIALRSFLMARSRSAIRKGNHPLIGAGDRSCTTAIVLGPGGHTGEMLSILSRSPLWALVPTHYLATRIGYDIVRSKVASFESTWPRDNGKPPRKEGVEYHFHLVREARKPATALSTSIIPTLLSVVEGVVLLCRIRPKLVGLHHSPRLCVRAGGLQATSTNLDI